MQRQYSIRPAQAADRDRLVDLMLGLQDHLEASNSDLWRMKAKARANFSGQIDTRLAAKHGCALVAEHEEHGVIGAVFGRIITNDRYHPSRAGVVDQAFVHRAHRRRGVGSRLVAGVCQFFAEQGVDDLSLRYVVGNEEAAAFWSSLGFSPRIVTAGADLRTVEARLAKP